MSKLKTNTEFVDAIAVVRRSACREFSNPLRWIGADRVLLDDVTEYGLRRLVIARRDEPPDVADLLEMAGQMTQAEVYAWCVLKEDGFWYLWMVWKEPTHAKKNDR